MLVAIVVVLLMFAFWLFADAPWTVWPMEVALVVFAATKAPPLCFYYEHYKTKKFGQILRVDLR